MARQNISQKRQALLRRLPSLADIVRGSLVHRTTRHSSGCAKCARGEGHPQVVLTISYPGGATRQISLQPEQVAQVRQWLNNYRKVKNTLQAISELNLQLLRPDAIAPRNRRSQRD
jgi:hypothetical protein